MQISLGLFIGVAVALALIVGVITHFVAVSNLRKNAESKIGDAEAISFGSKGRAHQDKE